MIASGGASGPAPDAARYWSAVADGDFDLLGEPATAVAIAFVAMAALARLTVFIPWWRRIRVSRRFSRASKWSGFTLLIAAAVAIIIRPMIPNDALALPPAVIIATPFLVGALGIVTLGVGLATTSMLDAKVLAPDGNLNSAWAIDVLRQVKDTNLDDAHRRVESPKSPDFGDLIAVADRTGGGLTALIGSACQLLFNSSPWVLQVTVLDGVSAIATLRRNGYSLEEVALNLERGNMYDDQHRKLLTLAAAFGALGMASHYRDVTGFYQATSWRSIGFLGISQTTGGEEHEHYLRRAIEEDPTSLLAEYDEVFASLAYVTDIRSMTELMDRLEPMINKAAALCRAGKIFPHAEPLLWHRLDRAPRRRETDLMMLRLMALYTATARNWAAAVHLRSMSNEELTTVAARVRNIRDLLPVYLARLHRHRRTGHADPAGVILRMKQRAALCSRLFDVPISSSALQRAVESWYRAAETSLDVEIKYSYACYLAQSIDSVAPTDRDAVIEEVIQGVAYVQFVEQYRELTVNDPELRVLGHLKPMRDIALASVPDAWSILRFAARHDALAAHGVKEPAELVDDEHIEDLEATLSPDVDAVRALVDGAVILRAARVCAGGVLDDLELLRAVRQLLDDGDYTIRSLTAAWRQRPEELVTEVARAVFWVPDESERERVAWFLEALVPRLSSDLTNGHGTDASAPRPEQADAAGARGRPAASAAV